MNLASIEFVILVVLFSTGAIGFVRSKRQWVRRTGYSLGLLVLSPLFVLGIVWPSAYTIAAVVAIPAVAMLLSSIVRPGVFASRLLQTYMLLMLLLSPLCLLANALL